MKSPKPNQNKPHQHPQDKKPASIGLAHPKITQQTKKGSSRCRPIRRGKKTTTKNIQSVMRPTRRHHPINGSDSIDQHTPQKGVNNHKPTKQKIIGTLSSSHTTHAHPNTPHKQGPFKAACKTLHTPTQQTKPKAMQTQVKGTINARFPTAISPNQPQSDRLAGRCRSR